MRVILKQDVENVGRKGDSVDVAAGFARNFLIPKRLAIEVTSSNIKMVEIERQALKKRAEKERLSSQELIQRLNQITLTFKKKAGEKDHIFGSVSSSDIKDGLQALGYDIEKKKICLDEPIKRVGNYTVPIKVYYDEQAEVKVEVLKEETEEEKKETKEEK
jgi:large subunit ribosomal protein L9